MGTQTKQTRPFWARSVIDRQGYRFGVERDRSGRIVQMVRFGPVVAAEAEELRVTGIGRLELVGRRVGRPVGLVGRVKEWISS